MEYRCGATAYDIYIVALTIALGYTIGSIIHYIYFLWENLIKALY